jgi:hypothetical protein
VPTPLASATGHRVAVVTLPYGLWRDGERTPVLQLRAIDGGDELALAEALAVRDSAASAGNMLIGRCGAFAEAPGPIGAHVAASLGLGDREVVLRALHRMAIGRYVEDQANCANCGEAIEYDLDLDQPADLPPEPGPWHRLELQGDSVECRVLTGDDLERAAGQNDPAGTLAKSATVTHGLAGGASGDILGAALARLDPNAETAIDLTCPVCRRITRVWLDAFDMLRRALAAGGGIMAQIHLLASTYGWTEADILALPRARRLRYCAMIAQGNAG